MDKSRKFCASLLCISLRHQVFEDKAFLIARKTHPNQPLYACFGRRTSLCRGRTTRTSCWTRALSRCPPGRPPRSSWPSVRFCRASENRHFYSKFIVFQNNAHEFSGPHKIWQKLKVNLKSWTHFWVQFKDTRLKILIQRIRNCMSKSRKFRRKIFSFQRKFYKFHIFPTSSIRMQVGSQSCPNRITTTRSSSARMAWSTWKWKKNIYTFF